MEDRDFLQKLKADEDREREFYDSAVSFIGLRSTPPQPEQPQLPEQEKTADYTGFYRKTMQMARQPKGVEALNAMRERVLASPSKHPLKSLVAEGLAEQAGHADSYRQGLAAWQQPLKKVADFSSETAPKIEAAVAKKTPEQLAKFHAGVERMQGRESAAWAQQTPDPETPTGRQAVRKANASAHMQTLSQHYKDPQAVPATEVAKGRSFLAPASDKYQRLPGDTAVLEPRPAAPIKPAVAAAAKPGMSRLSKGLIGAGIGLGTAGVGALTYHALRRRRQQAALQKVAMKPMDRPFWAARMSTGTPMLVNDKMPLPSQRPSASEMVERARENAGSRSLPQRAATAWPPEHELRRSVAEHQVRKSHPAPAASEMVEQAREAGSKIKIPPRASSAARQTSTFLKRPLVKPLQTLATKLAHDAAIRKMAFAIKPMITQVKNTAGSFRGAAVPMAAGAVAAGTLSYLASRPRGSEGKSRGEENAEAAASVLNRAPRDQQGFLRKVLRDSANFTRNLSQTYREHPVKSSLVSSAIGAALGLGVAKGLGFKRGV